MKMENFDYQKITVKEYREAVLKMCGETNNCENCVLKSKVCETALTEGVVKGVVERAYEVGKKKSAYEKIREKIESACDGLCNEGCPLMVCGNCMKIMTKKILSKIEEWENEQSIQQ